MERSLQEMTRSIEVLTPLERKQLLEKLKWELEISLKPCTKLTPSESDELDNCMPNA